MKKLNEEVSRIKGMMKITENKQTYDYGCAMLYFGEELIKEIVPMIDPEDLYIEGDGFGMEMEPHCTLLYGLHKEVDTPTIENITNKYTYNSCKYHNPSCFNNEKYDVLKYDISGDALSDVNKDLTGLPHTTDYPNYHPHMTIAYLKPGTGEKYVNKLKDSHSDGFLHPQHIIYSKPDGSKDTINITQD